jgi:hypothetical protein
VGEVGLKGFFLGLFVALALSLLDVVWSLSPGKGIRVGMGVVGAVVVGALGGLMAAMLGQALYSRVSHAFLKALFLLFGWTLTGLLIGASLGAFDFLWRVVRAEDAGPARRKLLKGVLGGTAGGLLGGVLFLILKGFLEGVFRDKRGVYLWSPSAAGFVALGACIGLAIGLAQVILKEAWLKVEKGFRAGRELILSKDETTIGRGEGCDVGLFGDRTVEKLHARIVRAGDGYLLSDAGTTGGTFLNGQRVTGPTPLKQGDRIVVGNCTLTFGERQKSSRKAD